MYKLFLAGGLYKSRWRAGFSLQAVVCWPQCRTTITILAHGYAVGWLGGLSWAWLGCSASSFSPGSVAPPGGARCACSGLRLQGQRLPGERLLAKAEALEGKPILSSTFHAFAYHPIGQTNHLAESKVKEQTTAESSIRPRAIERGKNWGQEFCLPQVPTQSRHSTFVWMEAPWLVPYVDIFKWKRWMKNS